MPTISPWKLIKFIFVFCIFLVAVYSWVYTFFYYQQNSDAIWLSAEQLVQEITLPIKISRLALQEPLPSLRIPVEGIVLTQIADTWGAARTAGRTHEGVDIFAETGTPVYAASPGYVVRVGKNNLGGNIVFTVGPGGVRYYYAHLRNSALGIDVGTPVTTDTVIGFVGNTGNAEQTPPHLHFGMYQKGPQNPYPLLIDRW